MIENTDYKQLSQILLLISQLSKKNGQEIDTICSELNISRQELIKNIELVSLAAYGDFHERELIDIYIERNRLYFYSGELFKRPIRLNYGEALALKIGLDIISQEGLIPQQQTLFDIQEKLEKLTNLEDIHNLQERYVFDFGDTSSVPQVQELLNAIEMKQPIQLRYYTMSKNKFSIKKLHPYHLVCHNGEWYLVAFCPEIKEVRRYRVDRMSDIEILKGTYNIPKNFSVEKFISPNMFVTYDKLPKVTIEFKKEIARWIKETNPNGKTQKDGSYILEIETNSTEWLFSILLKYGQYVEIIKPNKARNEFKELVKKIYNYYIK